MTTELATVDSSNPFLALASAMGGGGKSILKFSKGDWTAGQDAEDIPLGTKLAADVENAELGWMRWYDRKPVERRMVLVADGQRPPTRDSLGHDDKELWSLDNDGKPQDPWQETYEVPVRELDGERREFVMTGSSRGFRDAFFALMKAYGTDRRVNFGKSPIIELSGDKYKHPDASRGWIKTPAMPIVDWFDPAAPAALPAPKKGKF
jgi:hypothetical protein